jgi:hypothetical protein
MTKETDAGLEALSGKNKKRLDGPGALGADTGNSEDPEDDKPSTHQAGVEALNSNAEPHPRKP